MAEGKWISYLRVSTKKQGKSGLGLEAQRHAVTEFLNGGKWSLVKEFVEVESGKNNDRPQLDGALKACRAYGAKLVIAKLDRLSRNAHFLLGLQEAGVDFVAADMPTANRLTVGIMAMLAEEEGRKISERTKAALAAAKKRGVKLGGKRRKVLGTDAKGRKIYGEPVVVSKKARSLAAEAVQARVDARASDLASIIAELRAAGVTSLRGIAKALTERGIATSQGATTWQETQVRRLLARLPT
jgi:DNA invertase Pin-like site-specific DNA recombinase